MCASTLVLEGGSWALEIPVPDQLSSHDKKQWTEAEGRHFDEY